MWEAGPDDAWAVGEQGLMLHWNGTDWLDVPGQTGSFCGVWGSGPNDVWAAGDASVLRWTGSAWTNMGAPRAQYFAIAGTGPNRVAAATSGGEVFAWDGQRWSPDPGLRMHSSLGVHGAWASPSVGIRLVGGAGRIRQRP